MVLEGTLTIIFLNLKRQKKIRQGDSLIFKK